MCNRPQLPVSHIFGRLPDGTPVEAWALSGKTGIELEILTLGSIVRRLVVPDHTGTTRDVVLGFPTLEPYLAGRSAFAGAMAGRIAGRIPQGHIRIEEETYQLPLNEGENHLHGGPDSIDRQIWRAEPVLRKDGCPSLCMSLASGHMANGYPGNIEIEVTYTLTEDHALRMETTVRSDRATPVSLTHHGYFNLAGEGNGSIEDHELAILSDDVMATSDQMTLLGERQSVKGKACDLNEAKRIGDLLPDLFEQHGDLYWLKRPAKDTRLLPVARLTHPPTGQVMEVSTTNRCLQFYTGAGWDGSLTGKSGKPYDQFAGLCLETEEYPAATTQPGFGDILVHPDSPQHHITKFTFCSGMIPEASP